MECNKTTVDYLDITLNLLDWTYKGYQKPEYRLFYVHKVFNHPPNTIKQITNTIEIRLSNHLSNLIVFAMQQKIKKRHSKNQYLQKLLIFLLIFKVSTSPKITMFTVFSTEMTSQLAIAAPKHTMKSIITNHNKTILDKNQTLYKKNFNCINKNTCPLNEECQVDNIIYQASEIPFKKQFAKHKKSFSNEQYKNETKVSKEVWNIKTFV